MYTLLYFTCMAATCTTSDVYLYELVLALFKRAAMFCHMRCDNSGVGVNNCELTGVEPSN